MCTVYKRININEKENRVVNRLKFGNVFIKKSLGTLKKYPLRNNVKTKFTFREGKESYVKIVQTFY